MIHTVNCFSSASVHSMTLENLYLVEKWWTSTTTALILKLKISDIPFRKRIFTTRIILEQCPARQLETGASNLRLINHLFTTLSSHFFGNCMNIFHETEVQTVILRCWMNLYLNWFTNYAIKRQNFRFRFLSIL